MLIKIGNAFVDPGAIVLLTEPRRSDIEEHPEICVHLRHGGCSWIFATMDEAEAALIDAGMIENPYEEQPQLNEGELGLLAGLMAAGFEYLARDDDGKLYAYHGKPTKDGAYWCDDTTAAQLKPRRIPEGFAFMDSNDGPWSIAYLLAD